MSGDFPLKNPYLSLYAFFSRKKGERAARAWGGQLATRLGVRLRAPDDPDIDPSQNLCFIYRLRDAWIVYASVDREGEYAPAVWQELGEIMFGVAGAAWQIGAYPGGAAPSGSESQAWWRVFWGVSVLFGAEVTRLPSQEEAGAYLEAIPLLPNSQALDPIASSEQAWGTVWQLAGYSNQMQHSPHLYAILSTHKQAEALNEILFTKNHYDQMELSLQKCYHQLRQYEQGRDLLHTHIYDLDHALQAVLQSSPPKQEKLTGLSRQYVEFAKWSSEVSELQNTITINSSNYEQLGLQFNLFHEQDNVFEPQLKRLKHGQKQLDADKVYYNALVERVGTGLQAVRADLELRMVQVEQDAAREWRHFMRKQSDLELRLIEGQQQATENWRALQRQNEERKEDAQRREQQEIEREKQRDLLLALIGIVLGATELWSLWQLFFEKIAWFPFDPLVADGLFLVVISLLTILLLVQLLRKANRS